jgi:hypothetical protein
LQDFGGISRETFVARAKMLIQQRVAAGVLYAAILIVLLASASTAQPGDAGQAAIRAALTKWTEDFNAGDAQKVCDLFSPKLRYDYRGFPERNYQDVCDVLHHSLTNPTKRYRYALAIKEILVSGDLASEARLRRGHKCRPGSAGACCRPLQATRLPASRQRVTSSRDSVTACDGVTYSVSK